MLIATQPAMARLTVNGAWCEALFASTLPLLRGPRDLGSLPY